MLFQLLLVTVQGKSSPKLPPLELPLAREPAKSRRLMLEECDPIVLVLVLMLVLVGRPSAGAHGSKKLVLLAFLLSIHHLRNYEQTIILE
jgi:hypothetical protein